MGAGTVCCVLQHMNRLIENGKRKYPKKEQTDIFNVLSQFMREYFFDICHTVL